MRADPCRPKLPRILENESVLIEAITNLVGKENFHVCISTHFADRTAVKCGNIRCLLEDP